MRQRWGAAVELVLAAVLVAVGLAQDNALATLLCGAAAGLSLVLAFLVCLYPPE